MQRKHISFLKDVLKSLEMLPRRLFDLPARVLLTLSITFLISGFLVGGVHFYKFFKNDSENSSSLRLGLAWAAITVTYSFVFYIIARLKKRRENYISKEESISKINYNEFGVLEHDKYLLKIKNAVEFKRNLEETIILKSLKIEGLDFFSDFTWEFKPGINVLLGKNGYGKSYLLRLLAAMLYKEEEKSRDFFKDSKSESIVTISLSRDEEWKKISRNPESFFEAIGKVPILAIPDMRYVNKSKNTINIADTEGLTEDGNGELSSNGATHLISQQPYEAVVQTFLYQLCIGYLEHEKTFDRPIFRLIKSVIEELTDGKFDFKEIKTLGTARFEMKVLTEADDGRPLPIQKASQGTLSVLAIFGLIHEYLRSVFPDVEDKKLLNQHGFVIIDEIDAHLHPSWQRKIVGLLRKNFPNVQFILTAHNPLVIAGCYENEVSVLRKKDDGFFVEQYVKDLIGAKTEDIYRELFEVEDIDETFLNYTTELTFFKKYRERIIKLESQKSLSKNEDKELGDLYEKCERLTKIEKIQEERSNKQYDLELETLHAKIVKLKYLLKTRMSENEL